MRKIIRVRVVSVAVLPTILMAKRSWDPMPQWNRIYHKMITSSWFSEGNIWLINRVRYLYLVYQILKLGAVQCMYSDGSDHWGEGQRKIYDNSKSFAFKENAIILGKSSGNVRILTVHRKLGIVFFDNILFTTRILQTTPKEVWWRAKLFCSQVSEK